MLGVKLLYFGETRSQKEARARV